MNFDEVLRDCEPPDRDIDSLGRCILAIIRPGSKRSARVIAFLEDRRVLYAPDELEVPSHCVHSVLEIRHFISGELGKLDTKSEFAASLRAMRAACRKFLESVGTDGREVILYADHHRHWASWTFYSALGEMRGTFGVHLAKIAAEFKLDIEDRLATILPGQCRG